MISSNSLLILTIFGFVLFIHGTEGIPTTQGPPSTTVECNNGDSKVVNCYVFLCNSGHWEGFEFTATEACCKHIYHPKCEVMGFGGPNPGHAVGKR